MWVGLPTGSAMPLMWAHAEYVKLLRSSHDGRVYDSIPEVAERYLGKPSKRRQLEVRKPSRHVRFMRPGEGLRVHGDEPFTLHWSANGRETTNITESRRNSLGIDYVDQAEIVAVEGVRIQFTFRWGVEERWEGRDYPVTVGAGQNGEQV